MNSSVVAAWWGAIIATLVLAWDVFKWRKSRCSVRVSASPNMSSLNQIKGKLDDDKLIFVEVVNQGDKITTITHLVIKHYASLWQLVRRKPTMQGLVPQPGGAQPIPYELGPGKRWVGLIDQEDVEKKSGTGGFFYCGIHHSASNKAVMERVKLN